MNPYVEKVEQLTMPTERQMKGGVPTVKGWEVRSDFRPPLWVRVWRRLTLWIVQ